MNLTPDQLHQIGQLSDQWSFLWDKRRSLWIAAEDCPDGEQVEEPDLAVLLARLPVMSAPRSLAGLAVVDPLAGDLAFTLPAPQRGRGLATRPASTTNQPRSDRINRHRLPICPESGHRKFQVHGRWLQVGSHHHSGLADNGSPQVTDARIA